MKVTIYTINNSPFCVSAKNYLTSKGIAYDEKDVEQNKDSLHEMLTLSDHFTGVPYVYIVKDDGTTQGIKGFTETEFDGFFNAISPTAPTIAPVVESVADINTQQASPVPAVVPEEVVSAPSSDVSQSPINTDQNVIHEDEPTMSQDITADPVVQAPKVDDTSKQELGSIMDSLMQKAQTDQPVKADPAITSVTPDVTQVENNAFVPEVPEMSTAPVESVSPPQSAPIQDNVTRVDSDLSSQMPAGEVQTPARTPLASTPTIPDFPK